ncbi:hypothetical protein [Flavobacterium sp. TAB 87]|uniref:hypothetical protein n=1 Tax=Flavobacterium sp. TAB 87 TaxID=1729581 RepID=UPI00076DEBE6|nr:hypothetical protein [Flavobacterium sp. TAB 87]KVV15844.1 hypothetical protein AP058_00684 [Flavobacterium sp. TAB 87]
MEQKTNENKITFDLINGTFLPQETMEIINHIIQKKIDFHEIRNFSELIRFGISNENSPQRIATLASHRKALNRYLKNAKASNELLDIKATISIVPSSIITL